MFLLCTEGNNQRMAFYLFLQMNESIIVCIVHLKAVKIKNINFNESHEETAVLLVLKITTEDLIQMVIATH